MSHRAFEPKYLALAVFSTLACGSSAFAADTGSEKQLGEMVIKSDKPAVPANLPASTEGVTAKQIAETINAVTAAEVIQYLPSVHVRERYIGDRNAIVAMRMNSSIASAQTTVYADNLLLSNFLNNSFSTPPRWGMVSPEEIERVDVIYGPFSALYPGNSMGGVVIMTTRMPEKFEAHATFDVFGQRFKLYGTDKAFNGAHGSLSVGNKFGDWSLWMSGDHLDNHGHPQTFGAAAKPSPQPGAATAFTSVSGERRDIDTSGLPRIITSAIGADHTVQENGKIKVAYDFSPTVRATYTLGLWQNTSDTTVDSYLNVAGNAFFNTTAAGATKYVKFAGDPSFYTLSGASPGHSESEHWMHGLSVKSNTRGEWDWEAITSFYNQNKDVSRTASNAGFDSGTGSVRPAGLITLADGTGWQNLDLRGEWRPAGNLKSEHQVSFGYHYDRYVLSSATYNTSDWLTGSPVGAPTTKSMGKTETQAVYLQDAWRFNPAWKLVVGGRLENWKAFDGFNSSATIQPSSRTQTNFSPKTSLSFQASPDWVFRGSLGKAYRYPTVAEMFQVISLPASVKASDPNLKAENVISGEFAVERALESGMLRVSLFQEDKQDALISQTDTTVTPTISSIQNVDKVRTQGIEAALQASDFWLRGFDLSGSVTYASSKILSDSRNPGLVGTDQPRIPDWRATLVGTYHASDRLSYSLNYRFSGRQHNALLNTTSRQYNDINPDVYGAVSSYSVFDTKVLYRLAKQWTASVGVNNIGSYKYYVNPNPYPQRTYFASVKFDY